MNDSPRVPKHDESGVKLLAGMMALVLCVCFMVGAVAFTAAYLVAWCLEG